MNQRQNFSSGTVWEDIVGYSRAVRIGNTLEISGTVAAGDNGVVGRGDFYVQTKFILEKISNVLAAAGFSVNDVVRTRMFVTNISHWEAVGRAHGEFFRNVKPVTTMVEVSSLIEDDYLVEIEVTAMREGF